MHCLLNSDNSQILSVSFVEHTKDEQSAVVNCCHEVKTIEIYETVTVQSGVNCIDFESACGVKVSCGKMSQTTR